MENKNLKFLAKLAKNRLRKKNIKSQITPINKNTFNKEEFSICFDVYKLLDKKIDSSSPLGELIDYNKFNQMSALQKEQYIFELIDKYNFCKKQYLNHHKTNNLVC